MCQFQEGLQRRGCQKSTKRKNLKLETVEDFKNSNVTQEIYLSLHFKTGTFSFLAKSLPGPSSGAVGDAARLVCSFLGVV